MDYKSKEQIEIDFERAINQAQELESIAKDLSRIANAHIESAIEMLNRSFKGENAELFSKKGRVLTADMYNTADELISVSKNIKSIADIVYKTEKAALQICY